MPASVADGALELFARALPAEFRERVFEPALADLRLAEANGGRRRFARLVLAAECVRLGFPQYLWRRGRPTRVAYAVVAVLAFSGFIVARLHYAAAAWREQEVHAAGR